MNDACNMAEAWSFIGIISAFGLALAGLGFIYAVAYAQGTMHADAREYAARRTLRWLTKQCDRWLADGHYDEPADWFVQKVRNAAKHGLKRDEED